MIRTQSMTPTTVALLPLATRATISGWIVQTHPARIRKYGINSSPQQLATSTLQLILVTGYPYCITPNASNSPMMHTPPPSTAKTQTMTHGSNIPTSYRNSYDDSKSSPTPQHWQQNSLTHSYLPMFTSIKLKSISSACPLEMQQQNNIIRHYTTLKPILYPSRITSMHFPSPFNACVVVSNSPLMAENNWLLPQHKVP